MPLSDHWTDGKYLDVGNYAVTVTGFRVFVSKKGTEGVEFELKADDGKTSSASFYLTDASLWRLAQFAGACGMTKEEAANYHTEQQNSHNVLVNKKVGVTINFEESTTNNKYYREAVDWFLVSELANIPQPVPSPEALAAIAFKKQTAVSAAPTDTKPGETGFEPRLEPEPIDDGIPF